MEFGKTKHDCLVDVRGVDGLSITGFPFTLSVFDMRVVWLPQFYLPKPDISLTGVKRFDIRGYDIKITLDWSTSLDTTGTQWLVNQLKSARDINYTTWFYPSPATENGVVVLLDDFEMNLSYKHTLGTYPVKLRFTNYQEFSQLTPILATGVNFGSEVVKFGNTTIKFGNA